MSTPTKHALLSASAAERWLHCTAAPRLEEQLPEKESAYANEGRLAHAIAELKLRKKFIEPMGPRTFSNRMKKLESDPLYQKEMQGYTDEYIDYITSVAMQYEHKPYIVAEKKVDFSQYVPEGFGTADCIVIGAQTLHIIDFKYGKGVPVAAEKNPQMMLYALGALSAYAMFYDIQQIKMTIVQPRVDGDTIKEFEISRNDLIDWGVFEVKPKAQAAFDGKGEFVPGEWCRFCKAKAQCRARASTNTALEDFGYKKPPLLTDTEVGEILQKAIDLEKWASDLKEYALSAILDGKQIPGWKVVEGRSVRKFDDTDAAFETLKAAGVDEAMLYERKPLTLAAIEKMLGKAKFEEIAGKHIIAPPGKPTLVPESDKRPAYSTAKIDFRDIKEND